MKKRILSLILASVMMLSCFALYGCGDDTESDNDQVGRVPTTLTLWLPAAEGTEVDSEAVVNVENAINEYTQNKFSTAIKLKVFPAEDYDSLVLSKIYEIKQAEDAAAAAEAAARKAKRDAKKNNGNSTDTAEDTTDTAGDTTDETKDTGGETKDTSGDIAIDIETTNPEDYILPDDENGNKVYDYEYDEEYMNAAIFASYPSVSSDQFDIFLVHGFDEFELLYNDMLISDLSSNYENESKAMKSYINDNFIRGVRYDGSISVIPNNRAAGEIGVMLINKDVCEKLYYDPSRFDSVDKLFSYDSSGVSFIQDVMNEIQKGTLSADIIPVAGNYTPPNLAYLSASENSEFSLISALVSPEINSYQSFSISNVFKSTNFVNSYRLEKRINDTITPVAFDEDKEFAVGFFKGSYEELLKFRDKYEIVLLQRPQLTREDAFETAFAVSAYTQNLERSMEIITAINTSTELRTILQYGQEGVHWRYDVEDSEVIHVMNDSYKMDIKETGNEFITYPGDGMPISDWDLYKTANTLLYIPYTYGFDCNTETTAPLLKELAEKSDEIYKRISAMTLEEFNSNLESLQNEVERLDCYDKLTYVFGSDAKKDEEMDPDESIPQLFLDYVNIRGW